MYGRKSIELKNRSLVCGLILGLILVMSISDVTVKAATVTTKAPSKKDNAADNLATSTSSTTTTTRSPLIGGRRLANAGGGGGKLVATNGWQHHYQIVDTAMIERMFGLFNDYLVCRYDGASNCDDTLVHSYEQITGHRPEFLLKTHTLPAMHQPFQFMDNRHHNGQMQMQLPPWMPHMEMTNENAGVAGRWMPFSALMPSNGGVANVGGEETPRLLMDQAAIVMSPVNPNMPMPNMPIQGRPPMGDLENGPLNGGPQNGGPQNGGPQNGGPQNGGPRGGGGGGGPQPPQPQPQGGRGRQ